MQADVGAAVGNRRQFSQLPSADSQAGAGRCENGDHQCPKGPNGCNLSRRGTLVSRTSSGHAYPGEPLVRLGIAFGVPCSLKNLGAVPWLCPGGKADGGIRPPMDIVAEWIKEAQSSQSSPRSAIKTRDVRKKSSVRPACSAGTARFNTFWMAWGRVEPRKCCDVSAVAGERASSSRASSQASKSSEISASGLRARSRATSSNGAIAATQWAQNPKQGRLSDTRSSL